MARDISRNSEGVATAFGAKDGAATLSGLRLHSNYTRCPRVSKQNPGLEIANAFSVRMLPTIEHFDVRIVGPSHHVG